MDDIEKRLKESVETCLTSYEAWRQKESSNDNREQLRESIHELRKVVSRLEIEMAISEREQMAGKPLPIPTHRASRKGQGGDNGSGDAHPGDQNDNVGNGGGNGNGGGGNKSGARRQRSRRPSKD